MILRELNNEFKSTYEYNQFVRGMKNGLFSSIVPEKYFEWIKDYASAYFAWNILSTMGPCEAGAFEVNFSSKVKPLIKNNPIPVIPENREDALSAIYACFDNWDTGLLIKSNTLCALKKH